VKPDGALLLTRPDVVELLSLEACIDAVEEAFHRQGEGRAGSPAVLAYPSGLGGFHMKAARLDLERPYFAVKINANFPGNRERHGLPTIQGLVVLHDAESGRPLAVMDSIEITKLRTAAATAVAARRLARADSRVASIIGCGAQGPVQLRAVAAVLPIERALVFDLDRGAADRLAAELSSELRIPVRSVESPRNAAREADVCVTCTPSRRAFLGREDVRPGTFVAAVGADAPEKRELHGSLLADASVVVDSLSQCAEIGELHHAIADGAMSAADAYGELAEVVAGRRPGRDTREAITIFDSTGVALEDVAAAARVYREALRAGRGRLWPIAG
jgi:ornithine cyclodeaminase/alanine dehydrogenase-like protein (mu-crystallin family)